MVRRSCTTVLVIAALLAGPATAAFANPVTVCDNPADSALNQYCETIPSTGGAQTPGGARSLSVVLPRALVARILTRGTRTGASSSTAGESHRDRRSAAALLTLPAPTRYRASPTAPTVAATQPISVWIVAIVGVMAVMLAGGAAVSRRRSRNDPTA